MAIITPGTSEIHRLNTVATTIWNLCEDPGATRRELLDGLLSSYDVSDEELATDLDGFLEEAIRKGILTRVG